MMREPRSEYTANSDLEMSSMRYVDVLRRRCVARYTPPPHRASLPPLLAVLGLFAFIGVLLATAV